MPPTERIAVGLEIFLGVELYVERLTLERYLLDKAGGFIVCFDTCLNFDVVIPLTIEGATHFYQRELRGLALVLHDALGEGCALVGCVDPLCAVATESTIALIEYGGALVVKNGLTTATVTPLIKVELEDTYICVGLFSPWNES